MTNEELRKEIEECLALVRNHRFVGIEHRMNELFNRLARLREALGKGERNE